MALIVEDGSGLPDADALVSLDYCTGFLASLGQGDWSEGTTEAQEQAIRRATRFLNRSFPWKGSRRRGREQALEWPRVSVSDHEGYAVDWKTVPFEVKRACALLAYMELKTPQVLTPKPVASDQMTAVSIGPISIQYDSTADSADAYRPVIEDIAADLAPLCEATGGKFSGGTILT